MIGTRFPRGRWEPLSLRAKFSVAALTLLLLVLVSFMAVVEHRQREAIIGEVQKRGTLLAQNLAAVSTTPLLLYNYTALEQNVEKFGKEVDAVYAIVLDRDGNVGAYSQHPERVGRPLEGEVDRQAAMATGFLIQETRLDGEAIYDMTVPVFVEGSPNKWGTVRVGISKRRMEAEIAKTRWELLALGGLTLLCGGLASAWVANRIARPVRQLSEASAAIARGELNQRIEPESQDEIGQLALAFNHMASQLRQQRNEIEEAHGELRARFEELSDLKSYTDHILGSMTSGVLTLDLEGRVVTMNSSMEYLTGLDRGILGRYAIEVFGGAQEVLEALLETLSNAVPVTLPSVAISRADGSIVLVEVTTSPLRGGEGKALGVVGVFRDLTAIHELEEQLRRADRLAAVGTLAAGLAHEIKNPLVSLRTYTQLLPERFDDEIYRRKFREVVLPELDRINEIVEGLLDLSRPARLVFDRVSLPLVVDRILALYSGQIEEKRIQVVWDGTHDLPAVRADAEYLYRALMNIISNAIESMDSGGRLTLTTKASSAAVLRPRSLSKGSGSWVEIEINDTGFGISPEHVKKVFDPFFTTKKRGTGLGLAIAHRIIEDHEGRIAVRSVPGVGTTFTVILPAAT